MIDWLNARRGWAAPFLAVAVGALALWALHHLLTEVRLDDVRRALRDVPPGRIVLALALTAASYGLLTLYDVIALRIVGRPLPWRTAALASFTSYTLSHNLGFGALTGGSARLRIYTAAGLSSAEVVSVVALAGVAFWSGVGVTVGAALIAAPGASVLSGLELSPGATRVIGLGVLALFAAALGWLRFGRRPTRLGRWRLALPSARQLGAQTAVSALDLLAASAALLVLVPAAGVQSLPTFFLGYALAIVVALVSHVPGGVGVFEAVMIAALPEEGRSQLFAALILYRVVYYLVPLALAALLLVRHERRRWSGPAEIAAEGAAAVFRAAAPPVLAASVFVGGGVLLLSGALPAVPGRLHLLRDLVPLPFVEGSQIVASLVGTALVLIAPALYRRLDAGFLLARSLLIAGIVFSLAKGFDWEEALVLGAIAIPLQIARPLFDRRTALTAAIGTPAALAAAAVAVGAAVWLGLFSYKHVPYSDELWWKFAWKSDAPRFLRASLAAAVTLIVVAGWRLLGHPGARDGVEEPPGDPAAGLARSTRTDALLSLTGDKRLLWSPDGESFVMYQVQGSSWIAMADPVGDPAAAADLLWRLREKAHRAQGRLMLYQISVETVPIAIDLGLQLVKYGEEARVGLAHFSLDGPAMKGLRGSHRRAIREGAGFAVLPAVDVPALIPELRAVSDEWLAAKGAGEKAFSVGRFDPEYLARFPVAVVRWQNRIVAFANLWATEDRNELSVDLMRHVVAMPNGTMDFLFTELMLWGRAEGYRWFSLGLAPLSGLAARPLAPMWSRAGAALYSHGEGLYGFEGLRAYKEKFRPVWEPRWIAGPQGLGMARALVDLQTLVGGGPRSAARRERVALVA